MAVVGVGFAEDVVREVEFEDEIVDGDEEAGGDAGVVVGVEEADAEGVDALDAEDCDWRYVDELVTERNWLKDS